MSAVQIANHKGKAGLDSPLRLQAERLSDIVLTPPEKDLPQPLLATEGLEPSIELRSVRFRYGEGEPWILDGVSMRVAGGESVVLVGPSGCGKTTLLKIMLGQLQPIEGEVLIGGIPLAQLGLSYYRSLVCVVMQDDRLFAGCPGRQHLLLRCRHRSRGVEANPLC